MPKVHFGDEEVRTWKTHPDPFPLYPYEELLGDVNKVLMVVVHSALKLRAKRDFTDRDG